MSQQLTLLDEILAEYEGLLQQSDLFSEPTIQRLLELLKRPDLPQATELAQSVKQEEEPT